MHWLYSVAKATVGGYANMTDVCVKPDVLSNLECYEGKLEMIFKKYILTCVKLGHLISDHHNILICFDRHNYLV